MRNWIAMLWAVAFFGAAACRDANRGAGPITGPDVPVAGLPKGGDVPGAGPSEDLDAPVSESVVPPWGPEVPNVRTLAAQVGKRTVGALSCSQQQEEGSWRNKAPRDHQFLTKINLRFVCQDQILNGQPYPPGSPWYVHAFKKSTPTDQDWGEVPAWRVGQGAAYGWMYAYYDQRFYDHRERHVFARWISPYLEVWTFTDFEHGYGDDRWNVDWFEKTQPDLIVESLTHTPANPTTADRIRFTAVVKNIGNAAAGASQLGVQTDGILTLVPVRYGVPALGPGETHPVSWEYRLAQVRDYRYTATADADNALHESNESNNGQSNVVTVAVPPPGPSPVIRRVYALTHFAARIEWVPQHGATGYDVYRLNPLQGKGPVGVPGGLLPDLPIAEKWIKLTPQPTQGGACLSVFGEYPTNKCFTDLGRMPGVTYTYKVVAKYSDRSDGESESVSVTMPLVHTVTAQQAAEMLRKLGYAIEDIAGALRSAYQQTAQQAAQMFKNLGYPIEDIARALRSAYQHTAEQAAQTLRNVGYAIQDIARALQSAYQQTAQQVAQTLKNIGYAVADIARVLQSVFHQTAEQAAQTLRAIGYAIQDIARALQSVFQYTAEQAARTLKNIGYAVGEIARVLESVFGYGATQVAQALKAIGYGLGGVLDGLRAAFSFGLSTLKDILLAIGFGLCDVLRALGLPAPWPLC